jgi:RNA polymerase sigma-70 factor (ECF subfamily)
MRLSLLPDQELVLLYSGGNETCLTELLKRHQRKVFVYILSRVKDHDVANDVFQETFFKVIRTIKLDQYREEGKFISWVMRIAHNLVMDHFRDSARIPRNSGNDDWNIFDGIDLLEENVQDQLIRRQIEGDLKRMIERLPADQRELVQLRMYEELSFKEIAEKTGVSINTALGRFRYAVINLRKMMKQHNITLEV